MDKAEIVFEKLGANVAKITKALMRRAQAAKGTLQPLHKAERTNFRNMARELSQKDTPKFFGKKTRSNIRKDTTERIKHYVNQQKQ